MEQLKLEDFTQFHFLSNLRLAEDGRHAAFVAQKADPADNGYTANLWICETGSGLVRQLTAGGSERSFTWLDNQTLLFSAKRGKREEKPGEPETDFYQIRIDGGEAVKAFTVPAAVDGIRPLEGGRYLVGTVFDNAAPDLSALDKAEKEEARARLKKEADYTVLDEIPFWGNGRGVTNKKRCRLWTFDAVEGRLEAITGPLFSAETWELDESRQRLLYAGNAFSDKMPLTDGLYCCDLTSGRTETLLEPGRYRIHDARFAGGGVLLLASEGRRYGLNENPCFYRVENGEAVLSWDPDLSVGSSVGSDCRLGGGEYLLPQPDGALCLIVTDRSCSRIARRSPDGSFSFLTAADGSVDCFDCRAGKCLFIAMRGQRLQELYSLELATGAETQLTAFNEEALAGRYVAVPQPLTFTNGDGVEIDGWVLPPKDYDETKRYPAILDIHGGPKTVYGTVYYHEMQLWANRGWFVFYANPRGGDGRGNAFADIRGKYGTVDYRDLMDFTDRVLSAYPAIDEKRLGVTGGSYGGFMTNWIVGHTGRFAAAASQRSISNWVSMAYTTDIGYYFAPDQTGGTAWDGVERMWEQSPLKYADRCTTPTLFIHSDEDYRCWQAEGLQMFTALKLHGVESRLCLFKGENHELSRSGKPEHRIRRLTEITDWMERHFAEK